MICLADNGLEKMLKGIECFAVPSDQAARIGGQKVDSKNILLLCDGNIFERKRKIGEEAGKNFFYTSMVHGHGRIA